MWAKGATPKIQCIETAWLGQDFKLGLSSQVKRHEAVVESLKPGC